MEHYNVSVPYVINYNNSSMESGNVQVRGFRAM